MGCRWLVAVVLAVSGCETRSPEPDAARHLDVSIAHVDAGPDPSDVRLEPVDAAPSADGMVAVADDASGRDAGAFIDADAPVSTVDAAVLDAFVTDTPDAQPLVPGSLDPAFGTGGVLTSTLAYSALALTPDGLVFGFAPGGGGGGMLRLDPTTGALDATFGSGGVMIHRDTLRPLVITHVGPQLLVLAGPGDCAVLDPMYRSYSCLPIELIAADGTRDPTLSSFTGFWLIDPTRALIAPPVSWPSGPHPVSGFRALRPGVIATASLPNYPSADFLVVDGVARQQQVGGWHGSSPLTLIPEVVFSGHLGGVQVLRYSAIGVREWALMGELRLTRDLMSLPSGGHPSTPIFSPMEPGELVGLEDLAGGRSVIVRRFTPEGLERLEPLDSGLLWLAADGDGELAPMQFLDPYNGTVAGEYHDYRQLRVDLAPFESVEVSAADAADRVYGCGWLDRTPDSAAAESGFCFRVTAAGALDTTFGTSGAVTFDALPGSVVRAIALDEPNGVMFVAGSYASGSFVARLAL